MSALTLSETPNKLLNKVQIVQSYTKSYQETDKATSNKNTLPQLSNSLVNSSIQNSQKEKFIKLIFNEFNCSKKEALNAIKKETGLSVSLSEITSLYEDKESEDKTKTLLLLNYILETHLKKREKKPINKCTILANTNYMIVPVTFSVPSLLKYEFSIQTALERELASSPYSKFISGFDFEIANNNKDKITVWLIMNPYNHDLRTIFSSLKNILQLIQMSTELSVFEFKSIDLGLNYIKCIKSSTRPTEKELFLKLKHGQYNKLTRKQMGHFFFY